MRQPQATADELRQPHVPSVVSYDASAALQQHINVLNRMRKQKNCTLIELLQCLFCRLVKWLECLLTKLLCLNPSVWTTKAGHIETWWVGILTTSPVDKKSIEQVRLRYISFDASSIPATEHDKRYIS